MGKHHNIIPELGLKVCSKCLQQKPATTEYFFRNKTSPGGLWWYCKECCSKYSHRRYEKDRENIIARQIERGRNYILVNVHKKRLKPGAPDTLTIQEWLECLDYFDGLDAYTGRKMIHPSLDHIVPLEKGGGHEKKNVVPCDGPVNLWKHDQDMEEWFKTEIFFDENRLAKIKAWMNQ